jgi:hypothetical protein
MKLKNYIIIPLYSLFIFKNLNIVLYWIKINPITIITIPITWSWLIDLSLISQPPKVPNAGISNESGAVSVGPI